MILGRSPLPGPVGADRDSIECGDRPAPTAQPLPRPAARATAAVTVGLQTLREGSTGQDVEKLQRLLNVRLDPAPGLETHGQFDAATLRAVLDYQNGASISPDGVVGKQTWVRLLNGDKVTGIGSPIAAPGSSAGSRTDR